MCKKNIATTTTTSLLKIKAEYKKKKINKK